MIDRPFTPALSIVDIQEVKREEPPVDPPKPAPKKIQAAPIGTKPASHIIPSPCAFIPFRPQNEELPKTLTSFPPVSEQLKTSYTPSTGFSYGTPSKIASMQGRRTQAQSPEQQTFSISQKVGSQSQAMMMQKEQVQQQQYQQQQYL